MVSSAVSDDLKMTWSFPLNTLAKQNGILLILFTNHDSIEYICSYFEVYAVCAVNHQQSEGAI